MGDLQNPFHFRRTAVKMDGDDAPGACCYRCFDSFGIQSKTLRINPNKDRRDPTKLNGRCRLTRCKRGCDHFSPRTCPTRQQRELRRVRSTRHPDRVLESQI